MVLTELGVSTGVLQWTGDKSDEDSTPFDPTGATQGLLSGVGGEETSDSLPMPSRKSFRRRDDEHRLS